TGYEVPLALPVEAVDGDAARNAVAALEKERCERALDGVEDAGQKPGAELCRERLARRDDLLPRAEAARLLIHLHGRPVSAHLNDLADEAEFGNADDVVHLGVRHALCDDEGARNLYRFT